MSSNNPFVHDGEWIIDAFGNMKYEFHEKQKGVINPILEKENLGSEIPIHHLLNNPYVNTKQVIAVFNEAREKAGYLKIKFKL